MPQLELSGMESQVFWLVSLFLLVYVYMLYLVFPNLNNLFKTRKSLELNYYGRLLEGKDMRAYIRKKGIEFFINSIDKCKLGFSGYSVYDLSSINYINQLKGGSNLVNDLKRSL